MRELETSSYKLVTHHFGCILHELWVLLHFDEIDEALLLY